MSEIVVTSTRPNAIRTAWRSLIDRRSMPTLREVRAEMLRLRGVGASLRDIAPMVSALRLEAEASPKIDAVVAMYRRLDIVEQREAMRRMATVPDPTNAIVRLNDARSAPFHPVPKPKRTKEQGTA